MKCRWNARVNDLLNDDDSLSPVDIGEISAHIGQCAECQGTMRADEALTNLPGIEWDIIGIDAETDMMADGKRKRILRRRITRILFFSVGTPLIVILILLVIYWIVRATS